jgi:cytochrome P450
LNFIDPDVFLPERWLLEDERFANDHREAVQPFMFGPRDCLGVKVAMHELRLVVAKLLYKFDLAELCEESRDWTNQKVYTLWDKPPLMCQLRLANPLEVKEAGAVQG